MKSTDNIPALRKLWKQCFEADDAFLDLFFGKGFQLCSTYVLEKDGVIASALSVFPVEYKGHRGGYIYGVCTDPKQRGHHYAVTLLQEVEEYFSRNCIAEFMLLRPASGTLFNYYKKQGYLNPIFRSREEVPLPMIPAEINLQKLSPRRYFQLRQRHFGVSGIVEWTEEMCSYILEYVSYCHGYAVEIADAGTYLLSYPDLENPCTVICEEAGITPDGETTPLILSGIRILYPSATKAILSTTNRSQMEEYLLSKDLGFSPESTAFFSFAME